MDEAGLIQAASRGDLDAFNRLVPLYQDLVFNQAYRLIGEADFAADAAQDAFISAFRNIRTYRGGSFKAWLLRITTNICYDELRRRKRHPTTSLEPLDDSGEEVESPHWMADPANTPEEAVERVELGEAIQHCLDGLPEEFRTVVVLIDLQGFDYRDAAQSIGKPVGTVKSRLARARLRMQECLKGARELLPGIFRQGEEC